MGEEWEVQDETQNRHKPLESGQSLFYAASVANSFLRNFRPVRGENLLLEEKNLWFSENFV
jgi:hypothetical protein